METIFVNQVVLAIAILSTFFAIMLFLMICLPNHVTSPAWQRFKEKEQEFGSRLTFLDLHGSSPQDDVECIIDHDDVARGHGEHLAGCELDEDYQIV